MLILVLWRARVLEWGGGYVDRRSRVCHLAW